MPCEVSRKMPHKGTSLLLPHYMFLWPQQVSKDGQTHLICDFDKKAESLGRLEEQPAGDVLAEVLGLGAGLHLKSLGVAHT